MYVVEDHPGEEENRNTEGQDEEEAEESVGKVGPWTGRQTGETRGV